MTDAMSQNKQLPNESYKQILPSSSTGRKEKRLGKRGKCLRLWDRADYTSKTQVSQRGGRAIHKNDKA